MQKTGQKTLAPHRLSGGDGRSSEGQELFAPSPPLPAQRCWQVTSSLWLAMFAATAIPQIAPAEEQQKNPMSRGHATLPASGSADAMTPKRRAVLSRPDPFARGEVRQKVSKLSHNVVSPSTLLCYKLACRWFLRSPHAWGKTLPHCVFQFDEQVAWAIDLAWEEGAAKALVANLLSRLSYLVPKLRGELPWSWRFPLPSLPLPLPLSLPLPLPLPFPYLCL